MYRYSGLATRRYLAIRASGPAVWESDVVSPGIEGIGHSGRQGFSGGACSVPWPADSRFVSLLGAVAPRGLVMTAEQLKAAVSQYADEHYGGRWESASVVVNFGTGTQSEQLVAFTAPAHVSLPQSLSESPAAPAHSA